MKFISYAQNHEDVLIYRILKDIKRGFYIDIGANHPKKDSVTQAFYDRGWSGINIEPIEANYIKLKRDRIRDVNIKAAVADFNGEIDFYDVDGTGLSTVVTTQANSYKQTGINIDCYKVPTLTLVDIFDKYVSTDVHFLKIDVEGAEQMVIRGADWSKHRPWLVIVESTQPNSNIVNHYSWEGILLSSNYNFAHFDGLNRYYISYEKMSLAERFFYPLCCFDNYISYSEYKLLLSFNLMQLEIKSFELEKRILKEEISSLQIANKKMSSRIKRIKQITGFNIIKMLLRSARNK